jgi:hypothetical protein
MLKKLIELKHLEECKKYPSMPPAYIPLTKFSDKTANGLTRCVIAWINLHGGQAERINTTGRMIDKTKVVSDALGQKRMIGSVEWQKGTGTKGSADISSTIRMNINGRMIGVSVKWEVKIGKDRMSEHQKKYQLEIEGADGYYFVVKSFDDFMEKYLELTK